VAGSPVRRVLELPQRSLMARLVGSFLVLSIITVAIVGLVAYLLARSSLQDSVFERLDAAVALKADALDRWVDEQRRNVVFVGGLFGGVEDQPGRLGVEQQVRALLGPATAPRARREAHDSLAQTLGYVVRQTADAQEFLVLDLDGVIVVSTQPEHEGISQAKEGYFVEGSSGTRVQRVSSFPLTGTPTITISTPLFDDGGQRVGVLAANLNLERIDRILLEQTGLEDSGETYLVGTDRRLVGQRLATVVDTVDSEAITSGLAGTSGHGLYESFTGVPVIGAWQSVDELGAVLVAEMSQHEAFAPARRLAFAIGGVGLTVAALLGLATYLLSRRIARPILAITETATAVTAGDLDREAPVTTKDEVGTLAVAFNDMTAQLRENVETLERRVEERTAELSDALEAQREAEQRYRQLVEEIPMVVYTDKPDATSTSTYISPRVQEIFGYPPERWMEEPFFASVLHPDDRDRVMRQSADHLELGDRGSVEYRVIAADGRVVWVRDDSWVVCDDAGTPTHVQGVMIDVTEQTQAAAEIRRQKQYFESLVEISPAAVVTMDVDERVTGWNPAAERLFGFGVDEAVGQPIDDLILRTEELRLGSIAGADVLAEGRRSLIAQRMRKDGSLVDVEVAMIPLVVDGVHQGFYAVYHDISELQAARREADAANEAKSAFLAAMSHEIRTPMNAVIGMSGLLLGTDLDEDQRELAETVRSSSDSLLTIINDILDFSRIEAGGMELEHVPFDLRECVEGAVSLVGALAASKGLDLTHAVDDDVPRAVMGDAGRLRQILINVLNNAVKFTESGSVDVAVSAAPAADGRVELHFGVKDTGVGIRPDRMGRLFQSFSQEDASISRRYGGTGLGLAISKGLAEEMGGTVWAESDGPGKGSMFHVTIRTEVAEHVPAAEPGEPVALDPGQAEAHPLRILLVEDNVVNQKLATRMLGLMGYRPDVASNGVEAIDAVERQTYDLVLMDVQMPEMDGLEATRRIVARLGEARPRIVAMTANAMDGDRERCLAAGMDGYVSKPIRVEELVGAIVATSRARA
jgi:PAS domain S-box-containing protein